MTPTTTPAPAARPGASQTATAHRGSLLERMAPAPEPRKPAWLRRKDEGLLRAKELVS